MLKADGAVVVSRDRNAPARVRGAVEAAGGAALERLAPEDLLVQRLLRVGEADGSGARRVLFSNEGGKGRDYFHVSDEMATAIALVEGD